MPSANAQVRLGLMDYTLGDKPAALADFRKALQLDPTFRRQFDATNARMKAVMDDKEFVTALFPPQ